MFQSAKTGDSIFLNYKSFILKHIILMDYVKSQTSPCEISGTIEPHSDQSGYRI